MVKNSKQALDTIIRGRDQQPPKSIISHYFEISSLHYVTRKDISEVLVVFHPRRMRDE